MAVPVLAGTSTTVGVGDGEGTIDVNIPAGVVSGDLILLHCANDNNGDGDTYDAVTGYTQIAEAGSSTSDAYVTTYYRVSDGTEGATQTVTYTDQAQTSSLGWASRVTGAHQTTPIDVIGADTVSSSGDLDVSEITTGEADTLAIAVGGHDGEDGHPATTSATGWSLSKSDDEGGGGSGGASMAVLEKDMASAGLTGNGTIAWDSSDGSAGFMFSIAPAAAGGGPSAIAASTSIAFSLSANLEGVGDLATTIPITFSKAAALDGIGALASTIPVTFSAAADLVGGNFMSASIPIDFDTAADLKGAGAMAADIPIAFDQAASLVGLAEISAAVPIVFDTSADLQGLGLLSSTIPITFSKLATLEGAGALQATVPISFSHLATLEGQGALAATLGVDFDMSASIENAVAGAVSASITVEFTQSASIEATGALLATIPIVFDIAAALDQPGVLEAVQEGGGSGGYGKRRHGNYIPPMRYIESVDKLKDLSDDELAAIAMFLISELYD